MAFQTTSRSYTNLSTAIPDNHRNNSATTLASTLGNGAGPWGDKTSSIWGNGSSSTAFVPRALAADKPHTRELGGTVDSTDLKKGSGSLLASSESDSWRPNQQSRGDSAVRIAATQFRSSSTIEIPRAGSSASTNISPTTTRAPAINLTNTAFSNPRPAFNSAQTSLAFGEQPPNVYPKFKDRQYPAVDSAISPSSATVSPINERRPQWPTQYRESSSAPRSSHSDRPFFQPDYQRLQRGPPLSTRTPSISSQSNGSYSNMGNINTDYLPAALSQLSFNRDDRPLSRGLGQHPVNDFPRTAYMNHVDDVEHGGSLPGYNFNPSSLYHPTISTNGLFQSSRPQDLQASNFRPGHNLQTQDLRPRFEEFVPSRPTWQNGNNAGSGVIQRPAAAMSDQQDLLELRFAEHVMSMKEHYNIYSPYTMPTLNGVPPYLGYYHMGLGGLTSTMSPPPSDPVEGVQSAKLYDFKNAGKNNRRYELKDIYDHIAEFAGDQHGSRFIQTKLETANSDEKERVFREIEPNAIPLMTDVFGNYVIQKFFDHGHQEHKKILANKMQGQVLNLTTQMYGCRVVQKALEHVLLEQQAALVRELENHVLKCVKDQNGNHVIQKAIERCPTETISFVYKAFIGQVHSLSLHPYGCRVIQRCLERKEWYPAKSNILDELRDSMPKGMIGDSYGNYVVQHVVENGPEADRQHVLGFVLADLEGYSKHKFASNVVEKCIQYSTDVWRRRVVEILTTVDHRRAESEGILIGLIKDSYGNYVIQKLLDSLSPQDFVYFHQHLQPAMSYTKRTGSGKQVVSIEKKMQRFENMPGCNPAFQLSIPSPVYASNYGSVSNTPPALTADSRSIQSSSIPSVNGDAVEGATSMSRKGSEVPIDAAMLTR